VTYYTFIPLSFFNNIVAARGKRNALKKENQRDISLDDEADGVNTEKVTTKLHWSNLPGTEEEVQNLLSLVSSPNNILVFCNIQMM
jgi:hypothetical protein